VFRDVDPSVRSAMSVDQMINKWKAVGRSLRTFRTGYRSLLEIVIRELRFATGQVEEADRENLQLVKSYLLG